MKVKKIKFWVLLLSLMIVIFSMVACTSDDLLIEAVESIDNLNVYEGTTADEVKNKLPETIEVTLSNDEVKDVDLAWEVPEEYDKTNFGGEYEFIANFTVEGINDSVKAKVIIDEPTSIELSEDITEATTLEADKSYKVLDQIEIDANLTIEPGTRIEFDDGAGFELAEGNIIKAGDPGQVGTLEDDDLIVFTASDPVLGWDGIVIDSADPRNAMNNVLIEYVSDNPALTVSGGLDDGAYLTLTNSRIEGNKGYGLMLEGRGSTFTDSANNIYRNNDTPVYLTDNNMHFMDSKSDFTSNENDYIMVDSGAATRNVFGDQEILPLNVPYRIADEFRFEGDITIVSGAEFEFENDAGFRFEEDSKAEIGANPDGESREVIEETIFTGTAEDSGWWRGISFRSPNGNSINNAVIEYAGGADDGAIYVYSGGADLNLNNSTIRNNEGYGLRLRARRRSSAPSLNLNGNEFVNNKAAPIKLRYDNIDAISSTNTFNNNGENYIRVVGSGGDNYEFEEETWQDPGIPYRFVDFRLQIQEDSNLTIMPGVTILFDSDRRLSIDDNAEIIAEGNENNPIELKAFSDTVNWAGLRITSTGHNSLKHVLIDNAGRGAIGDGNLVIDDSNANVDVESISLTNGEGYGLFIKAGTVNGGTELTNFEDEITFNNNDSGKFKYDD